MNSPTIKGLEDLPEDLRQAIYLDLHDHFAQVSKARALTNISVLEDFFVHHFENKLQDPRDQALVTPLMALCEKHSNLDKAEILKHAQSLESSSKKNNLGRSVVYFKKHFGEHYASAVAGALVRRLMQWDRQPELRAEGLDQLFFLIDHSKHSAPFLLGKALTFASRTLDLDVMKRLLSVGAPADFAEDHCTALSAVCNSLRTSDRQAEAARLLISHGADMYRMPNQKGHRNHWNDNLLCLTSHSDSWELTHLLLQLGFDPFYKHPDSPNSHWIDFILHNKHQRTPDHVKQLAQSLVDQKALTEHLQVPSVSSSLDGTLGSSDSDLDNAKSLKSKSQRL